MIRKLLPWFLFIFFCSSSLAQDYQRFSSFSVGAGVGYPGLLMLDEIIDGTDFGLKRKASPPLHILAQTNYSKRVKLGIYLGYEYEKQSGTIDGFPGDNSLFIAGLTLDWQLTKNLNSRAFKPFISLIMSYSKVDFNSRIEGFLPQIRFGLEKSISEKILSQLRIGYGAAIIELSLIRKFSFNKP